ncbi:hypothetical protein [Leptolyngbya sp. NIES-2104]|uniref:hypothetical protein n=1 Tax=Leptolyngbya sp. NIES-2104 TaxID=1552121 RepID=UPI0006EC8EAE|nr:hypothetical protein [Leptolyngbya sp. NIES-2104]GAP96484.1 hypothetical protein NIES2104_30210 [Leptolyngbya sp. NIES-2104]
MFIMARENQDQAGSLGRLLECPFWFCDRIFSKHTKKTSVGWSPDYFLFAY